MARWTPFAGDDPTSERWTEYRWAWGPLTPRSVDSNPKLLPLLVKLGIIRWTSSHNREL